VLKAEGFQVSGVQGSKVQRSGFKGLKAYSIEQNAERRSIMTDIVYQIFNAMPHAAALNPEPLAASMRIFKP
jgi:hypothetical protein